MRAVALLAALFVGPLIGGGFGELPVAVILLLLLAGVVAHLVVSARDQDSFPRAPGLRALLAFVILSCVAGLFTQDVYLTLKQILLLFGLVGAYALSAALCRDARIAAAAVWTLTLVSLLICVIAVRGYAIQTGGGPHFWSSLLGKGDHPRLFGPFINPSFFAGFLAVAIPVAMGVYLVTRPKVMAVLAGTAAVISILALMLTGSKFGILSALFALIVLFVLAALTKSLKHARFRRLIIVSAILLPLLFVFRGPFASRIAEAEAGGTQVHSTTFRIYTWGSTIRMALSNPWVGVGPGAFETIHPRYSVAGPTKHAHNTYLQTAAETGIPALVLLLAALAAVFWSAMAGILRRRTAQNQSPDTAPANEFWKDLVPFSGWPMINCAIFAALIGSALTNLADSNWYLIGIVYPFWVMAGVLAAQSGSLAAGLRMGRGPRFVLIAACVAAAVLSVSFGLGDMVAPDQFNPDADAPDMISGYRLASSLSPLNPTYRRELAKWLLSVGDDDGAAAQIKTAIRLSPAESSSYYVQGVIAFHSNDIPGAKRALERSVKLSPNATKSLMQLALVRRAEGDVEGFEAALKRILEIEDSDFERVKGVPEVVDTSYAYAHAYFGSRYVARGDYRLAVGEFAAGIRRLEQWRSRKDIIEMRRATGALTDSEERALLELLRGSYLGLAQAYEGLGEKAKAGEATQKADNVPESLD